MSNQKLIDKFRSGTVSRASLIGYETNAKIAAAQGRQWPQDVLDALRQAMPRDLYYVFMGFCPNADINERLDTAWREQSICTMNLWDGPSGERQAADFMNIKVGDLIILKKNQELGVTMRLYGFGRVTGIRQSIDPALADHVLIMDWSPQAELIDVPAMACTATVNLRDVDLVNRVVPPEFHHWLGNQEQAA